MITDKKWKEMVKKWEKVGPVYQIPRRSRDRLKHFCDNCLPLLKRREVLEIGCNAGVFGLCISEVAEKYMGIEPGNKISRKKKNKTDYFEQALITRKESKKMQFLNYTVKEACGVIDEIKFDSLVMCYALYHLSDKEIDLLKEKILPRCDLVIIQNREQPRKTKHNSYAFYKSKNCVKFFEGQGYKVELIWGEDRGTKKAFSEIICRRVQWAPDQLKKLKDEKRDAKPFNMMKKVVEKIENQGKTEENKAGEAPVSSGPGTPQG